MNTETQNVSMAPSILMILPEIPWPTTTGGKRAHLSQIETLQSVAGNLVVIAANVDTAADDVSAFIDAYPDISFVILDTTYHRRSRSLLGRLTTRFSELLSVTPGCYSRLLEKSNSATIEHLFNHHRFDFIWVDHLHAMALLPLNHGLPIVLSMQNVESDLLLDVYRAVLPWSARGVKRWIDWKKMERLEARLLDHADAVVCLSQYDASILETRFSVPQTPSMLPRLVEPKMRWTQNASGRLLFVGQNTHVPNREAIRWLSSVLAPALLATGSDVKIDIVGTDGVDLGSASQHANLVFHGKINNKSLNQLLFNCGALLCPVVYGSGIKIKLLEAAANGVPIIATPQSIRGLERLPGCTVIDRDDLTGWVEAVTGLVGNSAMLRRSAESNLALLIRDANDRPKLIASLLEKARQTFASRHDASQANR